jgi:hypothetical protein
MGGAVHAAADQNQEIDDNESLAARIGPAESD